MASPTTHIRGAEVNLRPISQRFGGGDIFAAVMGMFVALGVLIFLGALIAAGNATIDYQLSAVDIDGNLQEIEVVGAVVAVVAVLVSFLAGGYTAGRMARYDGGLNGMGAALVFLLLVAVFGAAGIWAGTEYNAFGAAGLPDWFSQIGADDVTTKTLAAAAAGIVASLLGGYAGGLAGERYHARADTALVQETVAQAR